MTERYIRGVTEVFEDRERTIKLKLERELAEIRAQSTALVWLGSEEALTEAITQFFKAGQLKAGDLQDALARARLNFVGQDGKFIIRTTIPGASTTRLAPLDEKYHVIEFEGRQYDLTDNQAKIVQLLHRAHCDKRGNVAVGEIYKALGVHSGKMSDWFRGRNIKLYKKLILHFGRQHYRLDL